MPMPRRPDPIKHCRQCGKMMKRKRFSSGTFEDIGAFRRRVYCDRACMAASQEGEIKNLTPNNSRRQSAKKAGAKCEECQSSQKLHVHHRDENPLNNDPSNLQTLCASCHRRWHMTHGGESSNRAGSCPICGMPSRKLGMCQKHYQRYRKYGDPRRTKRGNALGTYFVKEAPDGSLSRL